MKDSGERRTFSTGAQRDRSVDKLRPDLIHPFLEMALGHLLAKGAVKYDDRNWEKGMPSMQYYASLRRHLMKWMLDIDDEEHAEMILFNAMGIVANEIGIKLGVYPADIDDRPDYGRPIIAEGLINAMENDVKRYADQVAESECMTATKVEAAWGRVTKSTATNTDGDLSDGIPGPL